MGCFAWYASSPWAHVVGTYTSRITVVFNSSSSSSRKSGCISGDFPAAATDKLQFALTHSQYNWATVVHITAYNSRMPTAPRRLSPVPAFGSGTGIGTSRNDNPYLAASLATHLRIAPPNNRTDSNSTAIPSPTKSPVRLQEEDLNDTPGESDPILSRMDLNALPKGYLEACLFTMLTSLHK